MSWQIGNAINDPSDAVLEEHNPLLALDPENKQLSHETLSISETKLPNPIKGCASVLTSHHYAAFLINIGELLFISLSSYQMPLVYFLREVDEQSNNFEVQLKTTTSIKNQKHL